MVATFHPKPTAAPRDNNPSRDYHEASRDVARAMETINTSYTAVCAAQADLIRLNQEMISTIQVNIERGHIPHAMQEQVDKWQRRQTVVAWTIKGGD